MPAHLEEEATKRAIVKHRIPTKEGDIIQDMGSFAKEYTLDGLCTYSEKASLQMIADQVQVDDNGHGYLSIEMTQDNGYTLIVDLDYLTVESVAFKWTGGFPQKFSYTLKMVQTP